jgi:hypothetical protein
MATSPAVPAARQPACRPGPCRSPGQPATALQRLLALNAAIWHNWQIGAPVKRSLIAYDH